MNFKFITSCHAFKGSILINENHDREGEGTHNENAIKLQKDNGTGAQAVADHSCETIRNKVEVSNNLNAQINFIGTHLDEMALANDGRLTSLDWKIDRFEEDFKGSM